MFKVILAAQRIPGQPGKQETVFKNKDKKKKKKKQDEKYPLAAFRELFGEEIHSKEVTLMSCFQWPKTFKKINSKLNFVFCVAVTKDNFPTQPSTLTCTPLSM